MNGSPVSQAVAAICPPASSARVLASRSTARDVQVKKLGLLLASANRHTYALRKLGISHPAGRVQDLEELGYGIDSGRVTVVDENGFSHFGVALYALLSIPDADPLGLAKERACTD